MNTFSREDLQPTKINSYLTQNRWLKYEFDQRKWVIDVLDKDNQKNNNITVYTWRYSKYTFKVRSIAKILRASCVDVELKDNKFKLL